MLAEEREPDSQPKNHSISLINPDKKESRPVLNWAAFLLEIIFRQFSSLRFQ